MSVSFHHECTRVPVTALASCGQLLFAAEGPYIRIYRENNFQIIATEQIFTSQVIHGISVLFEDSQRAVFLTWGGPFVRLVNIHFADPADSDWPCILCLRLSSTIKASDWILSLTVSPSWSDGLSDGVLRYTCAAVTARNALLALRVSEQERSCATEISLFQIAVTELVASSRCILYSADSIWISRDHILVAAGTAFGEILVWSWTDSGGTTDRTLLHHVFTGHEGSIFGVRLSNQLSTFHPDDPQRILASCSDDRTIRLWDISDLSLGKATTMNRNDASEQEIRETGFGSIPIGFELSNQSCRAIGWGHLSRVWRVEFLAFTPEAEAHIEAVEILSTGEDATSRTWQILKDTVKEGTVFSLQQLSAAAYHDGKNIWSYAVRGSSGMMKRVMTGGADSKITTYRVLSSQSSSGTNEKFLDESHTLEAILDSLGTSHETTKVTQSNKNSFSPSQPGSGEKQLIKSSFRSSKAAEFLRTYAFIDDTSFLFTTNSGKVLQYFERPLSGRKCAIIDEVPGLKGYSVATGIGALGIAFLAGAQGDIYVYCSYTNRLSRLEQVHGKVAGLFVPSKAIRFPNIPLLLTQVDKTAVQLLFVDLRGSGSPFVLDTIPIPFSTWITGKTVTSMEFVPSPQKQDFDTLMLGYRNGTIAIYTIAHKQGALVDSAPQVSLVRYIQNVHSKEAVTAMMWLSSYTNSPIIPNQQTSKTTIINKKSDSRCVNGLLISVGRDGHCAVHSMDMHSGSSVLVHNLALPFGPNIEGITMQGKDPMFYGFQNTNFVFLNGNSEDEIMTVDCGGAHRSWAFNPHSNSPAGTLVWTKASEMKIYSRSEPSHTIIRPGGHGREIKSVAVTNIQDPSGKRRQLIATGAEDTLIKLFEYQVVEDITTHEPIFRCLRTLRKHTTGIQHLQWSEDSQYLFSSGGCEEFYVWRVSTNLPILGIGVVNEAVCAPKDAQSDLRILSFHAVKAVDPGVTEAGYTIAITYSDSTIRVLNYNPCAPQKWHLLINATYSTICLTQCFILFDDHLFTSGSDGYVVFWPPLPPTTSCTTPPTAMMTWTSNKRIHQNTVKTAATHFMDPSTTLLATGGDDGAIAMMLVRKSSEGVLECRCPMLVPRAHASAVTACVLASKVGTILLVTSGNDQQVRVWEVNVQAPVLRDDEGSEKSAIEGDGGAKHVDMQDTSELQIKRLKKTTTAVADVSSMALLHSEEENTVRVLICGIGMEVIRLEL